MAGGHLPGQSGGISLRNLQVVRVALSGTHLALRGGGRAGARGLGRPGHLGGASPCSSLLTPVLLPKSLLH